MRRLRLLLLPAGAALGLVAERELYGWSSPADWLPDLAAGWALIGCGIVAWSSRIGKLMTATGLLWFTGNFVGSSSSWVAWISEHEQYAYRGPLVQMVLTFPRGRPAGRLERVAVAGAYVAAVVTPVWRSETTTIVLSVCIVMVASRPWIGDGRRALGAFLSSTFAASVLAVGTAVRLGHHTQSAQAATLLADQAALIALAFAFLAALLASHVERAGVTNLVVDLGQDRSGSLRRALATTLGDPTLEIGYWSAESESYVDDAGASLDLPDVVEGRSVTRIGSDGSPVAVVVHDSAVLEDPSLVEAVAAASRLAATNAQLQADVRAQLAELQSSRRRLLRSGDAQRRRLEQRLRDGVESRLLGLERVLHEARMRVSSSVGVLDRIRRAEEQTAQTLVQLRELGLGLHPPALSERGLSAALASLAEQCPTPVELMVSEARLPEEIEAAVFFVCSEALANVAKYASASTVAVRLAVEPGVVRIEVADDGVGGADPTRGSGLRGLADRVEAVGGSLRVEGRAGGGTRVVAEFGL